MTNEPNPHATFSNPPDVAAPVAGYSHLATVPAGGDLLVVAGQIGNDGEGRLGASIDEQYEQALRNVVTIMEGAGAGAGHIVKLNYYLTAPMDRERAAEIRGRVLAGAEPPTSFAYVTELARPEYLVEIEALATRPRVAAAD